MDEGEILKQVAETKKMVEEIYRSVEKTRKMFLWTMIISLALFVLPLIGLLFAIPQFLSAVSGAGAGL